MPKFRASIRGLGARLRAETSGDDANHPIEAFASESRQILNLPLTAISPNPRQPRKYFDEQALADLARSIHARGLLQPILVKRLSAERYVVVAGERRFRPSRSLGLAKIPALVTDGDELEIAIVENLQREDLRPLEEAEGLHALAKRFRYTQEQLATVVGKSRPSVAETLALLTLPEVIKRECRTSDKGSKYQLLQVAREARRENQMALWEAVKAGTITVRAARRQRKGAAGRPPHFTRSFVLRELGAIVTVRIKKATAREQEVLATLDAARREQERLMATGR